MRSTSLNAAEEKINFLVLLEQALEDCSPDIQHTDGVVEFDGERSNSQTPLETVLKQSLIDVSWI